MGRQKKKLSDFDENGTNRLETIKRGANLFSDQKVDFLKKIEYPWLGRALSTLSFRTLDMILHLPVPPVPHNSFENGLSPNFNRDMIETLL